MNCLNTVFKNIVSSEILKVLRLIATPGPTNRKDVTLVEGWLNEILGQCSCVKSSNAKYPDLRSTGNTLNPEKSLHSSDDGSPVLL
jgi:hypothetical protein